MAKRRVVHVPGQDAHRNPIPHAVVIGNLILPSIIGGTEGGPTIQGQVEAAFKNLKSIFEAAGASTDNIGKLTIYVKDLDHREHINKEWLKMFPDDNDRPARHVMRLDMPANIHIRIDAIGYL